MNNFDANSVCVAANGGPCGVTATSARKRTLWSLLLHLLTGGLDTLYTWQSRASQRRHLRKLEPRLIADMGITEAEAEAEASKPFWKQ